MINARNEKAAQNATSGARRGTQILIDSAKAIERQQEAKIGLGINAPHLIGAIKPSPVKPRNKYADLARGRLW